MWCGIAQVLFRVTKIFPIWQKDIWITELEDKFTSHPNLSSVVNSLFTLAILSAIFLSPGKSDRMNDVQKT
jgi:hypothetical protein